MSFRTAYHSLNKRTSPKPQPIRDYTDKEWAKVMDDYYKQQQARKK